MPAMYESVLDDHVDIRSACVVFCGGPALVNGVAAQNGLDAVTLLRTYEQYYNKSAAQAHRLTRPSEL